MTSAILWTILSADAPSTVGTIVVLVFGIGIFAIAISKIISKRLAVERMEGVWYCKVLDMQLSFTDPCDSFWVRSGEKIRCRCDPGYSKHHEATVELFCSEWDHPQYVNGKTLFFGDILQQDERSMRIFDYKSLLEYTFERTDKTQ